MPFGFQDGNDVKIDGRPAQDVLWKRVALLNGSSPEMNVNGSITPVNFSFSPASGETWYLASLSIFLTDNGTLSVERFGAITPAPTNGLLLQVQSKGVALDMITCKDNIDLALAYSKDIHVPGIASGFFESGDVFVGSIEFKPNIILQNSTSDYVRQRVRDNLTGIDYLRCFAQLWKAN